MTDFTIRVDSNWQHTENMSAVCRIPNGTIYVIGDEYSAFAARMYKSTDGGVTWSDDVQFFTGGYGGFSLGIWGSAGNKVYCLHEPDSGDTAWALHFSRASGGSFDIQDVLLLDAGRGLANGYSYAAPGTLLAKGSDLEVFYITSGGGSYRIDRKTSSDDGDTWSTVTIYDVDADIATGPSTVIYSVLDENAQSLNVIYKSGGTSSGYESWVKHLHIANDSAETATITTIDSTGTAGKMWPMGIEYDNTNDIIVAIYYSDVTGDTRYGYYESGSWTTAVLESENISWVNVYSLVRLSDDSIWIMKVPYGPDVDAGCVRRWKWDGVGKTFERQPMGDIDFPIPYSTPDADGKLFAVHGPNTAARLAYTDFAYTGSPQGAYFSQMPRVVDFALRPERIVYQMTDAGLEISMELGAVLPTIASILRNIEYKLSLE